MPLKNFGLIASLPASPLVGDEFTATDTGQKLSCLAVGVWTEDVGPASPHGGAHENGGADELDVTGLSGVLADPQVPAAHVQAPASITPQGTGSGLDADLLDGLHAAAFEAAGSAVAAVAAHEGMADPHPGYQRESEKGAASGYASLDTAGDVPATQLDKAPLPRNFIDGALLSYISANVVSAGAAGEISRLRDLADTFNISFTGILSADIALSGAGGLDTGVEARNVWYAVHVIADSAGVNPAALMLSLSADTPTLPAGYDKFRRVGWVRNGATAFRDFRTIGKGRERRVYHYEDLATGRDLLVGGGATTWTNVGGDLAAPPGCEEMGVLLEQTVAAIVARIRPNNSGVDAQYYTAPGASVIYARIPLQNINERFQYENSAIGGSVNIYAVDYREFL